MNRNYFTILIQLVLLLGFSFQFNGFAQTYEMIEVDITADVIPIESDLNSSNNEFSPVVFGQTMYFTSDRSPNVQSAGEDSWSKNKHLNVFQTKIKGELEFKGVKLVSERLANMNHSGPVSFSLTGDTLFFSKITPKSKADVLNPQLCYVTRYKGRWTKPKELPFNNSEFVFSHPFYDSKTNTLYFSSNKPGGKGGADLYMSELTDTGWGEPVALDYINSSLDEKFPFLEEGFLFFSRGTKEQGLDVMWTHLKLKLQPVELKGANSEFDDFGLFVFPGMTDGYISSGRMGNDDIFCLKLKKAVTIRNEMAGGFKYRKLEGEATDLTVQIVADDGFVLYETKTDEKGEFVFKDINYDNGYSVKALTDEDLLLSLKDKTGKVVVEMLANGDNVFAYRKLDSEKCGTLSLIPDDMVDFDLEKGHLSGQLLYENQPSKYPGGMNVQLINEDGEVAFETVTDLKGNFDFKQVPYTDDYFLRVPKSEDDMFLLVYDAEGNIVAQLKTNDQGQFAYRKLNPDFSNDLTLIEEGEMAFELNKQTIWGYFEYDNNASLDREGMTVKVFDENGVLMGSEITDKDGTFRFGDLAAERSLLFQLDEGENEFILDDFTLYIYDRYGQKIAGLKRGEDGFFTYRPLGYELDNQLSQIEEDNMDFILGAQSKRKLIQVYFNSNESKVKSNDIKIVNNLYKVLAENKEIKIEINAYADAKSSDEYNLILSQKRGQWIVDYLSKKGVDSGRFIVNAYGESYLIDEDNDALNRRAEIHLY